MDDFAVFILTHGRPERVSTLKTLNKQGYTGRVFIVVDDEDETLKEYEKKFGNRLIIFNKNAIAKTFDLGDNFTENRAIIYARNACFEIAKELGIKYFLQLDDDYTSFVYKFNNEFEYCEKKVKDLDLLFSIILNYYKSINALTVAMAQNGDFVGGKNATTAKKITCKRKAMNTLFCSTDRPFKFIGKINEDVNTYTNLGHKGFLFLTVLNVAIIQTTTQKNKGGMTELYLDKGTYYKSFYSVMYCPSFVKIFEMGYLHKRMHHKIRWNNAVPKIVREGLRVNQDHSR